MYLTLKKFLIKTNKIIYLFVSVSSSGHNVIFLFMTVFNTIVLFLNMLEHNLGQDTRSLPSSCKYFPIESCSSLKACTSRLVLAANDVRSHFDSKICSSTMFSTHIFTISEDVNWWRHLQSSVQRLTSSYFNVILISYDHVKETWFHCLNCLVLLWKHSLNKLP